MDATEGNRTNERHNTTHTHIRRIKETTQQQQQMVKSFQK